MRTERNVVVFLPNPLGDAVMATPALRALRQTFAQARITLVGKAGPLAALAGSGLGDETLTDISSQRPRLLNVWRMARQLRGRKVDLAVLLPNSFRSALTAWLGGCRRIAGYDRDGRGLMLTDKLQPPRDDKGKLTPVPAIRYYNDLVVSLGAPQPPSAMCLKATDADSQAAGQLLAQAGLDDGRPLVMLNPGGAFGPSKLWPAERFAALADELTRMHDAQIVINAAPNERDIARAVESAMKHRPLVSFADRPNSIGLLKGLMARTDLLVTNDTGARHFAAAMGRAVVTIFGSTDPAWAQLDYPLERCVRAEVPCGPCQSKHCLKSPQAADFHQCMRLVSVEAVAKACEQLLAGVKGRAGA